MTQVTGEAIHLVYSDKTKDFQGILGCRELRSSVCFGLENVPYWKEEVQDKKLEGVCSHTPHRVASPEPRFCRLCPQLAPPYLRISLQKAKFWASGFAEQVQQTAASISALCKDRMLT